VRQALKDFSLEATERIVIQWNQYIRIDEYMQLSVIYSHPLSARQTSSKPGG
jgi:hypothetical protein